MRAEAALAGIAIGALLAGCSPESPSVTPSSPAPSPSVPSTPLPQSGETWLLYQASQSHLAIVRLDGAGKQQIAADVAGTITNPDWNPDASQVVFIAEGDDGTQDLWIAPVAGGESEQLIDCAAPCLRIDDPAWSPDGARIAYSRTVADGDGSLNTLETVGVETGEVTVLLGPWVEDFTAGVRWAPDGASLAFENVHKVSAAPDADAAGVELAVMALDAPQEFTAITPADRFAETADWLPDGTGIVFGLLPAAGAAAPDLFTIDPEGSALNRVTHVVDDGGFATQPAASPDGTWFVFVGSASGEDASLLRVDATGGEPAPVIEGRALTGDHPRLTLVP